MTQTQIFITICFCICFYIYCLITGAGLLESLRVSYTKSLALLTGLIVLFALNEIVSLPFMFLHGSYTYLYNIVITLGIFNFIVCSHYLFFVKKNYGLLKFAQPPAGYFLLILILFLIFIQTAVPVFFSRFDGDDAFYIAISTSIQTTGKVFLNNPSIGLNEFIFPPNYQFTAYEILVTILSTLTGLKPVVMNHSVLPVLYIPMYYITNYALAEVLITGKTKQEYRYRFLFILLICLLTLFDGYSNYLSSSYISLKPWMGKTCTVNFCYPLLLIFFIKLCKIEVKGSGIKLRRSQNTLFFLITLTLIAGLGTSAIGLYLLPVGFFVFVLASILVYSWKKSLKEIFRKQLPFIWKAFIAAIPSAIFLVSFYLYVSSTRNLEQLNQFETYRSWLDDAGLFFSRSIPTLCLYIVASLYFGLFGNSEERIIFFWSPIFLILTFLNPALHDVVGHYLTSMPVYWRFFWLLPLFPVISLFTVKVLQYFRNVNYKWIIFIPFLFIFTISNFALNDEKFYATENSAKIPNDISTTVATIQSFTNTRDPNDLYLLSLPHYNIYLRQYTGDIALVMPRLNYVREAYELAGKEAEFKILENLFEYDENGNIHELVKTFNLEDLELLKIHLIITPDQHPELENTFKVIKLNNGDNLYISNLIFKNK